MKRRVTHMERRLQGGIVAVEMAFILLFVLILLPYPLFLGRAFWQYAVLQKVAHDAARYMSTIPAIDMKNTAKATQAVAVVQSMVSQATPGLGDPDAGNPVTVYMMCDVSPCGSIAGWPASSAEGQVKIFVGVRLKDAIFGSFTDWLTGDDGLQLQATVTMLYANK